jgi:hypothetical protein
MTTHTHSVETSTNASKLGAVLQGFRDRRTARAELRRLELELSTYRTAAEISELDAMLERSGDDIDPVYAQVIERLRHRAA